MKSIVLLAAVAALGACSQAAEETADTAAAETTAAATQAAAGMAGTYEFELDGETTTSVLMPDGMYSDTQDGKTVESGTWTERDGKTCFKPAGDEATETCFTTTAPDAQGVFTATPETGEPLTIRKVG